MPADLPRLLAALSEVGARFIVVGGMAMVTHGSAYLTADLDICYDRAAENLDAISRALGPFHPRLRGAPEGLPFRVDAPTLKAGMNFTLSTDAGDLDLLGELSGVGGYDRLIAGAETFDLYGHGVRVMGLDDLIRAKESAGRRKDFLHLEELREIRKRKEGGP